MKVRKQIILDLKQIPISIWIVTILIFIAPHLFDSADGDNELIWFVYIIPAFIFSFYLGIWVRLSTALLPCQWKRKRNGFLKETVSICINAYTIF